jgi:hypothetical protein
MAWLEGEYVANIASTGSTVRFAGGSYDGYDSQVLMQTPDPHHVSVLFVGGGYDGYDSQALMQTPDPHRVSVLFVGGGYDGYDSQALMQTPDPHHVSAVFVGGGYDGYDSQALIQSPDPHQFSGAFRGGSRDGYDAGALQCYSLSVAGQHGVLSGDPSGWYATGATAAFTVTATADPYYYFVRWSGDAQGGSNVLTTALTMDQPHAFAAVFAECLAANGTPEWWLAQLGWTNNFSAAETNDADHDGLRNWEEWIAGTDPTNRWSVLSVTDLFQTDSGFVLRWPSVSNRVYAVVRATNLLVPPHVVIATNLPAMLPVNVYTDQVPAIGTAFYRIVVEKP